MIRLYLLLVIVFFLRENVKAQGKNKLFSTEDPLMVRVTGSIKSIKKNTNDSTFTVGKFDYEESPGNWVTVTTQARTRGNFRLSNCFFPPVKLKLDKQTTPSTVFAGIKALKLVLPCQNTATKDNLIRREYLCYKMYEQLASYYFRTRLASIMLTEITKKKPRQFDLIGFFVEDNKDVARRGNAKIIELKGVSPSRFDDKHTVRNDFFQYMIGNADWSAVYQHNSNVLFVDGKYVPLPYDFDMSGFVDASYAHQNPPQLGTGDPRDRVYRGFCKSREVMQDIRQEFIDKESVLHAIIDSQINYLPKTDLTYMHQYLDGFYRILKDDSDFKNTILEGCRTK